jgi:hypothetical protein
MRSAKLKPISHMDPGESKRVEQDFSPALKAALLIGLQILRPAMIAGGLIARSPKAHFSA